MSILMMRTTKFILSSIFLLFIFTLNSFATDFVNDNFDSYENIAAVDAVWANIGTSVSLESPGYGGSGKCIQWVYSGQGLDPYEFDIFISGNTGNELYIQARAKVSSSPAGACKGIKLFGGDYSSGTGEYANTTFNFDFEDCIPVISHGSGATTTNDTQINYTLSTFYWDAQQEDYTSVVSSADYAPGTDWFTIIVYMKYNTDGNRDGVTMVWIDGVLRRHVTGIKNRHDDNAEYVERVAFGDYGNAASNFTLQMDDIIISDTIPSGEEETTAPRFQGMTFRGMGQ